MPLILDTLISWVVGIFQIKCVRKCAGEGSRFPKYDKMLSGVASTTVHMHEGIDCYDWLHVHVEAAWDRVKETHVSAVIVDTLISLELHLKLMLVNIFPYMRDSWKFEVIKEFPYEGLNFAQYCIFSWGKNSENPNVKLRLVDKKVITHKIIFWASLSNH